MVNEYCGTCGQKVVQIKVADGYGFDTETGQPRPPEMEWTCPTGKCGHRGKFHGKTTQTFWQMIRGKYECLDCGKVFKYPTYDIGW